MNMATANTLMPNSALHFDKLQPRFAHAPTLFSQQLNTCHQHSPSQRTESLLNLSGLSQFAIQHKNGKETQDLLT